MQYKDVFKRVQAMNSASHPPDYPADCVTVKEATGSVQLRINFGCLMQTLSRRPDQRNLPGSKRHNSKNIRQEPHVSQSKNVPFCKQFLMRGL